MKLKWLNVPLVVSIFVFGCNTPNSDTLNSSSEIVFKVNDIKNMNTRAGYDSPSEITSSDLGFGIYIVDDPADLTSSGNRADNHNIKSDGSTWFNATTRVSGTKLEWPEFGTVSAFAYCPFRTEISDITNIPIEIQSDQSSLVNLKASDFICAKAFNCQKNENGTIPLTFYHQLSKLKFNISWNLPIAEIGTLSSLNISADVFNSGSYNLSTGKVTTNSMYARNPIGYTYNKSSNSTTAEVILMPQEIPAGKFITITTEKSGQKIYYTLSLPENLILDASSQYNFNITLKPSAEESEITLNPSMLSIEKWEEVENGNWDLEANVKKVNLLKVSFEASGKGLTLVTTPSLPLHDDSDVFIYINEEFYFRNQMSIANAPTYCYMKDNDLGGKKYKLSLAAIQSNNTLSKKGTLVEDELMSYKIEPAEIYIPTSIHITPVCDRVAETIVFTASKPVETDITYRLFKTVSEESVGIDVVILKGTTKSQIIDVSAWNKNLNALASLKTETTDVVFPFCRFFRENVYYHTEWSLWYNNNNIFSIPL